MANSNESILQFTPLSSKIDYGFWHKLVELKLEVDKLDETERSIWGYYRRVQTLSVFEVECASFNENVKIPPTNAFCNLARGYCINKNTAESFKNCDKSELLNKYGTKLRQQIIDGEVLKDPSLLSSFVLLTFSDLKKHHFIYWFAFIVPEDITINLVEPIRSLDSVFTDSAIDELYAGHSKLDVIDRTFFGIVKVKDTYVVSPLRDFASFLEGSKKGEVDHYYLGFVNSSPLDLQIPSWYLRNFFALLRYQFCTLTASPIDVICLQERSKSYILKVSVGDETKLEKWIGWERNLKGRFGPRSVNLASTLDPVRLAENGTNLNLSLMKWRLVPELDLQVIKNTSCLLLGAGTLGCTVARNLVAWGVKKITFVDSGKVSYSNPPRQSLYTFNDSVGSVYKATAAASSVKSICPSIESTGIILEIPMPGHSTSDIVLPPSDGSERKCNRYPSDELSDLVQSHDVIFLLTDTRESRWLPTVLARYHRKLVITAALGFDSYLVMRHGNHDMGKPLGCYFCNDVTAPGNSTVDRTLDQQCTVTRPGVASIAASLAVELVVSILQHPFRDKAMPEDETILGSLPHSIRGYLFNFNQIMPATPAFENCVACSTKVLEEYTKHCRTFLEKVYESTSYLEEVTGIAQLLKDPNIDEIIELDGNDEFDESM